MESSAAAGERGASSTYAAWPARTVRLWATLAGRPALPPPTSSVRRSSSTSCETIASSILLPKLAPDRGRAGNPRQRSTAKRRSDETGRRHALQVLCMVFGGRCRNIQALAPTRRLGPMAGLGEFGSGVKQCAPQWPNRPGPVGALYASAQDCGVARSVCRVVGGDHRFVGRSF